MVIIMIEFVNVNKSFKNNQVFKNFNLEIKKGTIFGLVGINGAGKSTMLRLLAGVYNVDSGFITINDEDIYENESIKEKIFFLPDEPYYAFNLKGIDLINLYKSYYDIDNDSLNKHLKAFNLDLNKPIHSFSKGMKRQLFVSIAISIKLDYLLLDEAFDGLDPLARLYFKRELIKIVSKNNTTVIISSHALRELEDICDSFGLLDRNEIKISGDLNKKLEETFKYQLACEKFLSKEMIKDVEVINFTVEGKLIKIAFKGKEELFLEEIKSYKPIFVEKLNVTFEDLFIDEIEAKGYLK